MKVYLLNIVKNNVAKEKDVHYEHFLNLLDCFSMPTAVDASKGV